MESWIVIAVLAVLGYLIVLPIIAVSAWQRGNALERELKAFKLVLQDLRKRITQLEAGTPGPDTQPAPLATAARETAEPIAAGASLAPPPEPPSPLAPAPAAAATEPEPAKTHTPTSAAIATPATPVPTPAATTRSVKRPTQPRPPVKDSTPNPLSGLIAWFFRGNPLAKLGVLLLFFGIAYLFKYAADRDMFPIELRLAGVAALAIGLLTLGWRLRVKAPLYGLILQGGAIGALYLTSFAAFRIFDLLPHGLSFVLLIVICAASVTLAVLQRAQSLAVLASAGGYLAPVLLSTGGGSHIALFSYYALLSIGILAVSTWQSWRPLNLTGFFFTFGVGLMWGSDNYSPELYASCQFFLLLNLLIFGLLAVLFSLRQKTDESDRHKGMIDGTLVFGTPLVGFGLQYALTRHWEYGPAFSALGFAALYLPLALWLIRRWPQEGRRMAVSLLAVGAGFATLAIPLALSARWTALAWALEGLGVLWAGRTQQQPRMSWSGTALLILAALSGAKAWGDGLDTISFFLITTTLSLCWLAGAHLWREPARSASGLKAPRGNELDIPLLIGGIACWLLCLIDGAHRLLPLQDAQAGMLALAGMSASALLWQWLGLRLPWQRLRLCCALLWPFAALVLAQQLMDGDHPLNAGAWSIVWLVAIAAAFRMLHTQESLLPKAALTALHASLVWGIFVLLGSELIWHLHQLPRGLTEWRMAGLMTFCGAMLLLLHQLDRRGYWPLSTQTRAYWLWGLLPVLPFSLFLLAIDNALDGQMPGHTYLPLLNPLEESALFALLMLGVWRRKASLLLTRPLLPLQFVILGLAAWWANGVLLRTLAEIGDVAWQIDMLWDSRLIQTSFALAWTLAALACMLVAVRNANRNTWFAGAALLGIVIAKLFLVDSARGGGLARAIAFIGVALLILAIGYFAPLPPKKSLPGDTPQAEGAHAS